MQINTEQNKKKKEIVGKIENRGIYVNSANPFLYKDEKLLLPNRLSYI